MRFLFQILSLGSLLLPFSQVSQAQQAPTTSPPATSTPALSEDSVRVMSGLVQASVRQLRAIYFEADDARATQLVEAALLQIPAYNQRLSAYTASLPREQQQLLAQRLRQQPWQVELQTLLRSPQYKDFNTRTARSPTLKAAADRLAATGFLNSGKPAAASSATSTAKPAAPADKAPPAAPAAVAAGTTTGSAKTTAAKPAAAPAASPAAGRPAAGPAGSPGSGATPVPTPAPAGTVAPGSRLASAPKPAAARTVRQHTVAKGETLFAIARQYGVKPAQLQTWNNKPDNSVRVGEVLTIQATN